MPAEAGNPPARLGRARIQAILDGEDHRFGRRIAFALQGCILVSVVSIALDTLPDLDPFWSGVLMVEEWVIVTVFTLEYLARIYAAPNRLGYIFSFFGIIDLFSILPSLLMLGFDMRAMRALRAFRVFGLLKVVRYMRAVDRLAAALRSIAEELVVFAGIAVVVLYLCATAMYYLEHDAQPEAFSSIPQAMWWAVITLTTVGYGDVTPITTGGRIFTGFILMLALGIIAVPTGLVASALARERHEHRDEETRRHNPDTHPRPPAGDPDPTEERR